MTRQIPDEAKRLSVSHAHCSSMTPEARGVQGHKTHAEVSKITGCKTKNLAGSRDCEQHHSQNQISDAVTNLSTYTRLSDFTLMLVGFSALVY